jgi:hypothetical protein
LQRIEICVRGELRRSGIIDKHVNVPKCIKRRLRDDAAIRVVGNIAADDDRIAARRFAFRRNGLGFGFAFRVIDDDACALACKAAGARSADTGG